MTLPPSPETSLQLNTAKSRSNNSSTTPSSITTPENLKNILHTEQSKLIHLDPVPQFKEKAEIKTWLQKIFYPLGIEIVIERSDSTKVIFKCKASRRGKNAKEHVVSPLCPFAKFRKITDKCKGKNKSKRSVSRFNICPFRIRATYSLKCQKWSIVVMNSVHSHDLEFNPDSEEYKKFKMKLRQDNDSEAIKRFDELEYRKRANLPLVTPAIPCDCGLTSEIRSFDVVLPTSIQFTDGSIGLGGPVSWNKYDVAPNFNNAVDFLSRHRGTRNYAQGKKVTKGRRSSKKGLRSIEYKVNNNNNSDSISGANTVLPEFPRSSDFEVDIGSGTHLDHSQSQSQRQQLNFYSKSTSESINAITTDSIVPQDVNLNEIDFTEMFMNYTRHNRNHSHSHRRNNNNNNNNKHYQEDKNSGNTAVNPMALKTEAETQTSPYVIQEFDPLMDGIQAQSKSINIKLDPDDINGNDNNDNADPLNPYSLQFSSISADSLGSIDPPFTVTGITNSQGTADFEMMKLPILGTDVTDLLHLDRDQTKKQEGQQGKEEFMYGGFDTLKSETPDQLSSWIQIFK